MISISRPLFAAALLLSLTACQSKAPAPAADTADSLSTHRLSAGESRTMQCEADSFLARMPKDLQRKQTLAIRKAIEGDNTDLIAVRNARNTPPAYSKGVKVTALSPSLRFYEPASDCDLPLLIYLHGGGWTIGSLNSCARYCDAVAASGKVKVLAVDYRLAPEHPYPAGLDDCTAALRYAWENARSLGIDRSRISVGGDSSGGNLAIATALSPSCHGKVSALVLFYPVTKAYDDASVSWQSYGKGYGLDAEIMEAFNTAYIAGNSARTPLISVGDCDDATLARLPRTLLVAAERDILCDQGKAFVQRLGSRATRIEFPGTVHLFITVPGQETAFRKAVKETVDYLTV